jgi:hypothetical protein
MGTEHHIEPTDAHHRATEATGAMRTMRVIVQDAYGDTADVLRLEEIIRPEIADDVGVAEGSFAEYARADEGRLAPKPRMGGGWAASTGRSRPHFCPHSSARH